MAMIAATVIVRPAMLARADTRLVVGAFLARDGAFLLRCGAALVRVAMVSPSYLQPMVVID
jgi:hypothetical protein